MIKFIHRCNNPAIIEMWLEMGHGVEVDVRFRYGQLYTGHDGPEYPIKLEELFSRKTLLHAKDFKTFAFLNSLSSDGKPHFFFQDKDDVALTSWGFTLYHSNIRLDRDYRNNEIVVLPKVSYGDAWGIVVDVLDVSTQTNQAVVAA